MPNVFFLTETSVVVIFVVVIIATAAAAAVVVVVMVIVVVVVDDDEYDYGDGSCDDVIVSKSNCALLQFLLVEKHEPSTPCVEKTWELITNHWQHKWQSEEVEEWQDKHDKQDEKDGLEEHDERDVQGRKRGQHEDVHDDRGGLFEHGQDGHDEKEENDKPDEQDEQDEHYGHAMENRQARLGPPNLVISVLSDKEPLTMSHQSLKSIVYNLVRAADEAKGKRHCQFCM